jgi:hypothetical protein
MQFASFGEVQDVEKVRSLFLAWDSGATFVSMVHQLQILSFQWLKEPYQDL